MDWISVIQIITYFLTFNVVVTECGRLNDYILDYQPLVYDRDTVHKNHERIRRTIDEQMHVRFHAYGRDFQLKLWPATGIFSKDHQVYLVDDKDEGLHFADTSFIYQGQVVGEERSSVFMSVHGGNIEGHFTVPGNTYHIEPASKYLQSPAFHTIIYPETHLDKDPYRKRREAEKSTCAVDHLQEWMAVASKLEEEPHRHHKRETVAEDTDNSFHNIYSAASNQKGKSARSRVKRAALGDNNTCPLLMRADPLLYDYYKKKSSVRELSDQEATDQILSLFSTHVNAITLIYQDTQFETYTGGIKNRGIRFIIRRSVVMKNCTADKPEYCSQNLDVSNFLELTSLDNHDAYCLSFTFTYRDFTGGTLGLAWVATESSVHSGLCGRYSTYTGGRKKSLNTGIVTLINYGKTVPSRVSQLTFAHEVGHNFGSPHDIGSDVCAPFGTSFQTASDGNYIMFPSATGGDKRNNNKFSICSKDNMTRIIQQVVDGQRTQCLVKSDEAFCGNKITEPGEECDCGYWDECDPLSCCVGRPPDSGTINNTSGCKLLSGKQCSPLSGPCCGESCQYRPKSENRECKASTDCAEKSVCNGTSSFCPTPAFKDNNTFCNLNSKVCSAGECIAPVCRKINDTKPWEECFHTLQTVSNKDDLCYVACKNPSTQSCISSNNKDELNKQENRPFQNILLLASNSTTAKAIKQPPGAACDNFRGYCDVFSKCQSIDAQGPFNQLTNMIFNPVTFQKIRDWIVEYWWAVLLMAIGVVVFMGVFIKVFGYNTPSYNPKQRRAAELRQQQQQKQLRQQQHSNVKQGRSQANEPPYTIDLPQYNSPHYGSSSSQYDRISYGKNHIMLEKHECEDGHEFSLV